MQMKQEKAKQKIVSGIIAELTDVAKEMIAKGTKKPEVKEVKQKPSHSYILA
jgi:hypothetical protein